MAGYAPAAIAARQEWGRWLDQNLPPADPRPVISNRLQVRIEYGTEAACQPHIDLTTRAILAMSLRPALALNLQPEEEWLPVSLTLAEHLLAQWDVSDEMIRRRSHGDSGLASYEENQYSRSARVAQLHALWQQGESAMATRTRTKPTTTKRDTFISGCTDAVREGYSQYLGGQFWAYWIAYVSFYLDVCDWTPPGDIADRHRAYADAQMSACWWWPHTEFVTVSERPSRLERDEQGRLHSTTGPAIAFRDGWRLYSVHGVQVDEQVIEAPHTMKPEQITNQPNAEVRRVMMDMFTPAAYIQGIGADPLDTMPEFPAPNSARLWRAEQRDDEPLVMLEMVNGTAEPDGTFKRYWERVPERGGPNWTHGGNTPVIRRVKQALAWRIGIPESEYVLAAES